MPLSSKLLDWYDRHGRDLPWRGTRDPYRILISEIMLQQTQVPRVILFYKKWLKQFPNFDALARATNANVIRAWSGLGYNRRALVLRDIARTVAHNGVPTNSTEWLSLKGIGPYTAAALGAFCHGERVLPIDTNIRRVLGRVLLGKPFPQPSDDDRIRSNALRITRYALRFHDIPQALFDLATAVCTKNPNCATCPLRVDCPSAKKFLTGRVRVPKQTVVKAHESRHRDKPFPDRIYRGRILKIVRDSRSIRIRDLGLRVDPAFDRAADEPWIERMVARMTKDGLVKRTREEFKSSMHHS